MRQDPEVFAAADAFAFCFPRHTARRPGERTGRSTGSSLEFQDYREYAPGDDIRHLDWSAYARSDALMVRMYRDEVSPRTEVILDASRSMSSGRQKSELARQLTLLFAELAVRSGGQSVVYRVGDRVASLDRREAIETLHDGDNTGRRSLVEVLAEQPLPLKHRSLRIVVSDFLFPHDPDRMVRMLGRDAAALWLVQLLDPFEAHPSVAAGCRLEDLETGRQLDIVLDADTISGYRRRLQDTQHALMRAARRAGGSVITIVTNRPLLRLCAQELCAGGLLQPA